MEATCGQGTFAYGFHAQLLTKIVFSKLAGNQPHFEKRGAFVMALRLLPEGLAAAASYLLAGGRR